MLPAHSRSGQNTSKHPIARTCCFDSLPEFERFEFLDLGFASLWVAVCFVPARRGPGRGGRGGEGSRGPSSVPDAACLGLGSSLLSLRWAAVACPAICGLCRNELYEGELHNACFICSHNRETVRTEGYG